MKAHNAVATGVLGLSLLVGGALTGCSQETTDQVRSAATDVGNDAQGAAANAGARASAETFRGLVKNKAAANQSLRTITVLESAKTDIPGNAAVTGITDTTGDGLDDDGYVQVTLEGRSACITLPASGDNTEVKDGACPAS